MRFHLLAEKLQAALNIKTVNLDTLKTLELYSDENGYNRAAALLADSNSFYGLDMARFGDSISIILDRETCDHVSILKLYDQAIQIYRKYYQYEQIKGSLRETIAGRNLTKDENRVYRLLKGREMPSSAISEVAGFGKNKTVGILKALVEKGYAEVSGKGRGTRYSMKL